MTGTGTQADPFVIGSWSDFITAVGTSGAYVEFPKNLVSTSDTDVDANKLYVDSSGVVQTNVQPSDLANLYENTFTLDANNYAPTGLASTITINCASINGYGGTIKNLASSKAAIFKLNATVSIEGLATLNFNVEDHNFIEQVWRGDYNHITKCIFSGRIYSQSTYYFDRQYYSRYLSCAFTVTLVGMGTGMFYEDSSNTAKLDACRVKVTKETSSSSNMHFTAKNTYITGSINQQLYLHTYSTDIYNVLDISAPALYASNLMTNLANSDKCSNITNLISVTTEDLTNAETLAALGFPIQT